MTDALNTAREALERIAKATPNNTNSATAAQMASWTQAVAETALSAAEAPPSATDIAIPISESPPAQTSEQAGEAVRKAIEELLEAANRVYRHGNNPGTQWKALSTAIDSARQALAALSRGEAGAPPKSVQPKVDVRELVAQLPEAGAPSREALCRLIHETLIGSDADELIHHPAAKSWEPPTEPRWKQWGELADAILALYPTPPALKASELGEDQKRRAVPLSTISEGWRPIDENTPKGHSQLLGFVDGEVRVIKWTKTSHVPLWGWCLVDQGPEDCDLCSPTHWMPLPAPPAPAEGGES